jgi:peptidoglycan hydrolase-like protein with peptidoglycan-binding domain
VPTDSFQPILALGGAPVTPITRQLALGAKGDDVTTLQRVLKSLGLFNTDATGYLGTVTKNAVTAFQKQNQLAAVGVVGPQTRALINNLLSSIKLPF